MKEKNKSNNKKFLLNYPVELSKLVKKYSQEENISETAVIIMALQKFFTNDVADESLFIAKMSSIDSKLQKLISKTELGQKFLLDFAQYNFLFFPALPEDTQKLKIKFTSAGHDFKKFLIMLRRKLKNNMPSLEETMYGDMLEKKLKDEK